jgi:hypothetical protein
LTCKGTFKKTWGLKPWVAYWVYTMVVRSIITYAAMIWWPRLKYKMKQAKMSKFAEAGLSRYHRSHENGSYSCI